MHSAQFKWRLNKFDGQIKLVDIIQKTIFLTTYTRNIYIYIIVMFIKILPIYKYVAESIPLLPLRIAVPI